MRRNQIVHKSIDPIKEKIERCIQNYMSLEETVTYLHENHQTDHVISRAIWENLQRDNPDFFKEYYKRCEVARQIAKFNELLAQQVDMMHKFREIEFSYAEAATQFQGPNDQVNHHQDQVNHHQWIDSNDFASNENSNSFLIDPSLIVEPPQPDLYANYFVYDSDLKDTSMEQIGRDLDDVQQISQQNFEQPQHLTDQQVVCCPQEMQQVSPQEMQQVSPQSLASNNLYFGGDGSNNYYYNIE